MAYWLSVVRSQKASAVDRMSVDRGDCIPVKLCECRRAEAGCSSQASLLLPGTDLAGVSRRATPPGRSLSAAGRLGGAAER